MSSWSPIMLFFTKFGTKPVFVLILSVRTVLICHADTKGVVPLAAVVIVTSDPGNLNMFFTIDILRHTLFANIVIFLLNISFR